jgi:CBS domain-containing protein
VDIRLNLQSESVEHAAPAEPLTVEPDTPVRDVLALLKEHNVGSLLICREGVLVGIFTERDALRLMAKDADLTVPIESVMVADPVTCHAESTVAAAIQEMSAGGYRRLPIVDDEGRAIGVIKTSGIVHYLVEHFPSAVYNLPPVTEPGTQEREGS